MRTEHRTKQASKAWSPSRSESTGGLQVSCATDFSSLGLSQSEWDAFIASQKGMPCHALDYCKTWWRYYGGRSGLRVFTIFDGARLVGILPFFLDRLGVGPASLCLAKLVVSDSTLGFMHLPVEKQHLTEALVRVTRHLFERTECHAVCLSSLVEEDNEFAVLSQVATRSNLPEPIHFSAGAASIIRLPRRFDDYLKRLGKNDRTNFRRGIKRLQAESSLRIRLLDTPREARLAFRRFSDMHTYQWCKAGEGGHFLDWPRSFEFHSDLCETLAAQGKLFLMVVEVDGQPVAYEYGYGLGKRLTSLLAARLVSERWRPYGLGRISLISAIELAIEGGYEQFDLGTALAYKADYLAEESPVRSVLLTKDPAARLRLNLFRHAADWFDELYFRRYFKTLAPKLPWQRSPLSNSWIRSQL